MLGEGWNLREVEQDPTAHAEVVALRGWAPGGCEGCTLVVTMEPARCAQARQMLARVQRIVLGAWDPKSPGLGRRTRPAMDRTAPRWSGACSRRWRGRAPLLSDGAA